MTPTPQRPIVVSCGEPAGIGPEIAAKAWQQLHGDIPFVWIGDPAHLPPGTPSVEISDLQEVHKVCASALAVLPQPFSGPRIAGTPQPAHAQGVIDAIKTGVDLVHSGQASALCTAPIHKQALQDGAGFSYPGHTEFLAALSQTKRVVMMLASDQLRVVPTTIHIPLEDVKEALTRDLLIETLRITEAGLIRDFGIPSPRIAVAGLNPHAGEGGKMGREEIEIIGPVIEALRADGMTVHGPLSADTMFHAAARKSYDAAVCMYHDQALIPIKTLDFDHGVNVTLGLPFIRTSPDHGTALDIAGTGQANPTSMIEALRMAAKMAAARA